MSDKPVGLIEIGTNSVKFLVSKLGSSGEIVHVLDRNEVTRIGQGLDKSGFIMEEAMERTLTSIEVFLEETKSLGVEFCFAFATMALRSAINADEFSLKFKSKTGLELKVLSGREEADYSLRAVRETMPEESSCWLFDTGGGSTEFAFFAGMTMEDPVSLDLGALTLTERFFPHDKVERGSLDLALSWISLRLDDGGIKLRGDNPMLVGTGGNLVTMASVASGGSFIPKGENYVIDLDEIQRQVYLFADTDVRDRVSIPGVPESRARVILGGACIALAVARSVGVFEMVVSTCGLRHGLMREVLSHSDNFV